MKKPIPAHIRNLADKYYLEQCDRLGQPAGSSAPDVRATRPKPPKAIETGVWIHPDMQRSSTPEARAKRIGKDRKEGLSLEAIARTHAARYLWR